MPYHRNVVGMEGLGLAGPNETGGGQDTQA